MLTAIKTNAPHSTANSHYAKKTGLLCTIGLILILTSSALAGWDDPVNFDCAYLKMAVEDELGIYDPTEEDMKWLTSITYKECTDEANLFDAKDCDNAITDLSGLEYAYNLTYIDFHLNKITSISPLENLIWLEDLRLGRNYILDLGPLKNLTRLTYLDIHGNGLSDLTPLSGLTNLQTLRLRWNSISDITPLSGLGNLRELHIHGNDLSDISPLSGLTRLTTLYVYDNQISDISALAGLVNLSFFSAMNNQISDVSALAGLSNLSVLGLDRNQISDISPLAELTHLTKLDLRYNPVAPEACDIYPRITANNPGLIYFKYDPCLSEFGLTISSSSGGSVSTPGEGVFEYDHETAVPVTATAQSDHHFVNWTGTAATAGRIADPSSPSITITVDGNYTLEANFVGDESGSPSVSTYPANNVRATSARLEASLEDHGQEVCEGWFRYWIKGNQAQTEQSTAKHDSLHGSELYARDVIDLLPGTAYYFQAVAENSHGRAEGNIQEFITLEDVIHVDDDAVSDPAPYDLLLSDPQEDGTADHPYDSIQEAIEQAQDLDKIRVHEGRYYETLNLMGKRLEIGSAHPGASEFSAYPVIDAQNEDTVVTFNHGETSECVLSGLVLTGGLHSGSGAMACIGASPTIKHCLIVGNCSTDAAGTIIYCENSHSLFQNVTVYGNASGGSGSAFSFTDSNALIANSILWNGQLTEITVTSGTDPIVIYSNVQGSWPGLGNIDTDPLFASPSNRTDPGDPNFAFLCEDYHLLSEAGRWNPDSLTWQADELSSPCIDAGDPDNSTFLDETVPNGRRINMGVYGGTAQASLSPVSALAHWRLDETSGNRAFDTSEDHDGTVYGATWTDGLINGALAFDGIDDYIDFGNDPGLAPDQLTIALWINAQATSGSRSLLRKAMDDKDNDYDCQLFSARYPAFAFGDGSRTVVLISYSKLPLDEWTHIAFTRHETEAAIYINGNAMIKKSHNLALAPTDQSLIVGGGSTQSFQGKIDDVQIFDYVLSEKNIAAIGNNHAN